MAYFRSNNLFRVIKRHCSTTSKVKENMMNTKLTLYGDEISPPVRFVLMTASMLEIKLEFHKIELFKSENKSPFFTKINPLQKVPALRVGSDVICDSHAIASYLCRAARAARASGAGAGAPDLYPQDPLLRAKIDETLFFNSGTLFPLDSSILTEYFSGKWPADETKVQQWLSAIDYLEHRLNYNTWLASDQLSIGDLCCATTVSSVRVLVPLLDRHLKVKQWLEKLQNLPCYEINTRGLERLKSVLSI